MVERHIADGVIWQRRIGKLNARIQELEALLGDAVAALDDLGACDDLDCQDDQCPRVLVRLRAALPERTPTDG